MFINSLKPITLIGVSVRTLYAKVNWSKNCTKRYRNYYRINYYYTRCLFTNGCNLSYLLLMYTSYKQLKYSYIYDI